MPLTLDDPETQQNARVLADRMGLPVPIAVRRAIEIALQQADDAEAKRRDLLAIVEEFQALPILDDRTPDEILDYDENGLPR